IQITPEGTGKIHLAREVRAVPDPYRQRLRAQFLPDLDAFDVVSYGLTAHGRVRMRKRAELVRVRLTLRIGKSVGVLRIDRQAEAGSCLPQTLRIRLVPRDMQRNGGCRARQLMNDGAILDLVEYVARLARAWKTCKARTASAHAP